MEDIFGIIICSLFVLLLIRGICGKDRVVDIVIGAVVVVGGVVWFIVVLPSKFFAKFSKHNFNLAIIGLIEPLIIGTITGIVSEKLSVPGAIFWFYVCHIAIWLISSIVIIFMGWDNKEDSLTDKDPETKTDA